MPPADPGDLAFSLARFSDHGRRRSDQNPRRRMLARFDLHVLSLRNAADSEPDQPLSPFRAAMVPQTGNILEPFHRACRALVFIWTENSATHCRRVARSVPSLSDRERKPFVSKLSDDRSISRLLR